MPAWFSPDSGIISPVEQVVATSAQFADAAGLLLSGNTLYVGTRGNGSLRSTSFVNGVPGSSFTQVNGVGSGWDAWGMFLVG